MTKMANHIQTWYHIGDDVYENDLYSVVWKPYEYNINNTTIVCEALINGIAYMIGHRNELLQYNPENNWGDYDSFLQWLIDYKNQCEDNPDCEITA